MTVTEKRRRGLGDKVDEVFGAEHGSTMMELLDPPWDTLATKADLAPLATQAQLGELRAELGELRADLELRFARTDVRFAELELRLERSIRTSIIASMAIQTTVIGILLSAFVALT